MNLHFFFMPFIVFGVSYSSCGTVTSVKLPITSQPSYRTVDSVKHMQIYTVNLRILTPIEVKCANFGSYFGSPKETEVVRNTERDSVLYMLAETKSIGKVFDGLPDTRGTLSITYNNKLIETFCFDDQLIYIGDSTYYLSPSFRSYLYKISGTEMPAPK